MKIICQNKKASFEYFLLDKYEAGIKLKGTEIKSIRAGKCNINDAYVIMKNNRPYILNMFISQYKEGNIFNHEETRSRKLLMHKKEILKLNDKISLEGYTLIPLKIYFKNGKAKVSLGVCKGKHTYDKKESLKEKDIKRELEKDIKLR